jgi:hypothetical protein
MILWAFEANQERSFVLRRGDDKIKQKLLLVESKTPKELVQTLDTRVESEFSKRSEAIQYMLKTFLEASTEGN